MSHLLAAVLLYAALVAQVALRHGGAGLWTPNLMLLVGLASAGRLRGGILWAAAAGLICDVISGRPLGVTMLVATLAAAVSQGALRKPDRRGTWRIAARVFLCIAAVEAVSRFLAATVIAAPNYAAEILAALRIGGTTAIASVVGAMALRGTSKLIGRNPGLSDTAALRPRAVHR